MKLVLLRHGTNKVEYIRSVRASQLELLTTEKIELAKNYIKPLHLEREI